LDLIEACNGAKIWGLYTAILADCFQISQLLGMTSFQHCPREGNKVAHNLARFCTKADSIISWDDGPPSHVVLDALNDLALLSNDVIEP
jgi:hypothetical protein